ncbi:hypothetical protein DW969_10905 [Eubacterium sp. AM47-9]|nr:hypothetical protein DW969_10905 [Eubacterium sp. AM47-9]
MGVLAKLSVTDDVTTTFKEIRKQNKSLKDEMQSTGKELKETWDTKYKPAIDSTSAMKSIRSLQSSANKFKEGVNTRIRLNDDDMRKLNKAKAKLTAFGRMVASPFIKIKDYGTKQVQALTMKLQRLGNMVITPIVKLKDMALNKLKSSIKLFQQVKNYVMDPIIRIRDQVTSRLALITGKLKATARTVIAPVIRLKDQATAKLSAFKLLPRKWAVLP